MMDLTELLRDYLGKFNLHFTYEGRKFLATAELENPSKPSWYASDVAPLEPLTIEDARQLGLGEGPLFDVANAAVAAKGAWYAEDATRWLPPGSDELARYLADRAADARAEAKYDASIGN